MRILVIGGTGTLGRALIKHYSENLRHSIVCLSRDPHKQADLQRDFPAVRCVIGDVTRGIGLVQRDFDIVYHVAALKHVDALQRNVGQASDVNFVGTGKAVEWAIANRIPRFAFCSTDKAVYPINAYGYSKAMAEVFLQNVHYESGTTHIRIFRWGNVIGSRGSVVHEFKRTLLEKRKVRITHADMTRFWIRLDDAVDFMVRQTEDPKAMRPLQVPAMKAAKVIDLARAVAESLDIYQYDTEIIGLRPGEKLHEDLVAEHDGIGPAQNSRTAEQYSFDELLELVKAAL